MADVRRVGASSRDAALAKSPVMDRYGRDVLSTDPHRPRRPAVSSVAAERGLVVEHRGTSWCGAVVRAEKDGVTLEDRHGRRRIFGWEPAGFAIDGRPVTLTRPSVTPAQGPARSRSGSTVVRDHRARVARGGRIWVEGIHDAELVEHVWGHDLRVEGVVVEPLHGIDDLAAAVRTFAPGPGRRLGVLVDHLVAGTKEHRIASTVRSPHVLVTGHPYVDVWQAIRPQRVGLPSWPVVPRGTPWKQGICAALGMADERAAWERVLGGVRSYADLEQPMLRAVEELIDFVTQDGPGDEPGAQA